MGTTQRWARVALGAVLAVALLGTAACSGDDGGGAKRDEGDERLHLPVDWEAMGDSFSSGAGAPPYETAVPSCYRSAASWPRKLATDSPAGVDSIVHVACGGATGGDLIAPQGSSGKAQLPPAPDPSIDLVTFTIGGNDIGFGSILTRCLVYRCPKPENAQIQSALAALEDALLDRIYPTLRRTFPNAQLVHVGYPRLTPERGSEITGCVWLSGGDRTAAEGIVEQLDRTIRSAARRAKVTYVDVFRALAGHELCTPDPWVVSITSASGGHPTAKGYEVLEHAVAEQLGLPLQP